MSAVAIITARGGSKRIPRKNIRSFLGKPIIAYAIQAARESGLFDEVMVSTDDTEIASISQECGASVPFLRRAETADDYATTADVLREVLSQYEDQGRSFEYACCLYPTAPFVTPRLLKQAFSKLTDHPFDTVYPVQPFSFPIQRAVRLHDSKVAWFHPEYALTRSQDLEPAYHDAGQFYFFNVTAFQQNHRLITDNSGGIVISELGAHDIDNEADWQIAEIKFKMYNEQ
ncbi:MULTISPECIES: pseudaminic acid cytidylyltransferase [unclassified Spirosoma]|uniref:pseudaminic acid cytidylyltransferase n=1 Tax=unclassified Spirosoma TaxID=2621999 RepID=UPI000969158C|nr:MULTISPECIES: pseudaminic acid cytidylyltransferase [unclassified Spirosoma]MBN8825815.1 pseudaminic acid cytidylyltransferase [Spirosoma sp.]OJW74404.1 MAG: pseudaminic acid cytidylyltransferase [Spirosoma sp. 48-14]